MILDFQFFSCLVPYRHQQYGIQKCAPRGFKELYINQYQNLKVKGFEGELKQVLDKAVSNKFPIYGILEPGTQ